MARVVWRIDGARVRELRLARGWTIAEMSQRSGIGERTISEIELGTSRGRPETARTLAKTFDVPVESLLVRDDAPAPASSTPLPPPKLPRQTRLDALADLERARGIAPPPVGKAKVPVLTAVRMQDAFATHAVFDGKRFFLEGILDQQRALSTAEARALRTKVGVGARFHVIKDVLPGEPLGVTVHAKDGALARELQSRMKRRVRLLLRLAVVGKGEARPMSLFASARKRAWCYVVESVES